MLIKAKSLHHYQLDSLDGEIGKVQEFYFDDQHWAIRYLVADTGDWLLGRRVLISPYALVAVNSEEGRIAVALSRQQIEDSPAIYTDQPVSRHFEEAYYAYYGWPTYWGGWGAYSCPVRSPEAWKDRVRDKQAWDPHLRSTHDVRGHHVYAADGDIGHVEDFVIDDETWAIRYLVIDTSNWWQGKKVLVSPRWIQRVSWEEAKVFVSLSRAEIQQSPEYSETYLLDRDYETRLHRHYNLQGYWVDELAVDEHSR